MRQIMQQSKLTVMQPQLLNKNNIMIFKQRPELIPLVLNPCKLKVAMRISNPLKLTVSKSKNI